MLIYRVEHIREGGGPYGSSYDEDDLELYDVYPVELNKELFTHYLQNIHSGDSHPCVAPDVGVTRNAWWKSYQHFYCGFISMEQYRQWFRYCYAGLHAHDYEMRIYSVNEEDVLFGKKQVAFVKERATLIATRPIIRSSLWMTN